MLQECEYCYKNASILGAYREVPLYVLPPQWKNLPHRRDNNFESSLHTSWGVYALKILQSANPIKNIASNED